MKRLLSVLLIIVAVTTASAQGKKYVITGKISDAEGVEFLLQSVGGSVMNLGSGVVKDGTFVIKGGSVDYPQNVMLTSQDKKQRLSFFLENSEITITGSLSALNEAKVTGSKTQDEYYALNDLLMPVSAKYSAAVNEYQSARKSGNEALTGEKIKQINDLSKEMTNIQKDFILGHPSSFVSPVLLRNLAYGMGGNELEAIIKKLDRDVAKTPIIADLESRVEVLKSVEIGKKAPDFTQNDPSGKPVSLSSLTGKNYLLIDFWAGWCGPCRAENPNVVRVYNEFKDKGFDILGVSLDRTAAEWTKAIADDKLTWNHVSDLQYWKSSAAKLYGVNSIPANFLLDKNGVIIARNLRGEELYNKIKELLGSR